jgi:predicted nucleic acid-binding protein
VADPFFDTNILVDWLKDRPQAVAELSRYKRHRISRIVWAEILAGEPLEQRDTVQQIAAPFEVVEIDAHAPGGGYLLLWPHEVARRSSLRPRKSIALFS